MKILVHMCCAPCGIYPVAHLRNEGMTVMGYFYRHNIHPYTECLRRQDTLKSYAESIDLKLIHQKDYDLEGFIQQVAFRESERCRYCYSDRLTSTAKMAKRGKFDRFTTTLLYSKFQNHELIRSLGEAAGKRAGVPFYYHDFRVGWQSGNEQSRKLGMYRQSYCGCIYSEKDRYYGN
ncbi:MAG: epoxyqueuosine reductase QueH [Deltaproteobacteria bacterium]|nr:epoxyqueuosine reductase QueH [Deltaproteobacteria bacterium]